MKKYTGYIIDLITISFVLTLLGFTYCYMWFSIETIPFGRVAVAFLGSVIFAIINIWVRKGMIIY